jgi:hypothetical protein
LDYDSIITIKWEILFDMTTLYVVGWAAGQSGNGSAEKVEHAMFYLVSGYPDCGMMQCKVSRVGGSGFWKRICHEKAVAKNRH